MNKILVEITSPAAGLTYDMFVPDTLQIGEMIPLISDVFSQTSGGTYSTTEPSVLCDYKTGFAFDLNKTVKEANITNGSKLIIF